MKETPVPLQIIGQALRDWWDDWVNVVLVNLAWILSWFTIVLGPPATLGLYHVTNQLAHGQSRGLGGLWEGIRRYFWVSWLWFLLNLVVVLILTVNVWFYLGINAAWAGFLAVFVVALAVIWWIVQFYALGYLMEQKRKNLGLALRNGLFTALSAPGYSLVVASAALLLAALSIALVFPLLLGGPALIAALGTRAVLERVKSYRVRDRDSLMGED